MHKHLKTRLHEPPSFTRSSKFFFPYFGVQCLICYYGVRSLGPPLFAGPVSKLFPSIFFWHVSEPGTPGLMTSLMALNCLVAVYLWSEFRRYRHSRRRRGIAPHAYFIGCAVVLMWLQYLYLTLPVASPPRFIPLDLTAPIGIP